MIKISDKVKEKLFRSSKSDDRAKIKRMVDEVKNMKRKLEDLKLINPSFGKDEYYSIEKLLERLISKIYSEKEATELRNCLYSYTPDYGYYGVEEYVCDINRLLGVINTILKEYEICGLDDFKPVKEKIEKERQIGSVKSDFSEKIKQGDSYG